MPRRQAAWVGVGALVLFVGVGWSWQRFGGGGFHGEFQRLLREDASLLRAQRDPSWWDQVALPLRQWRLESGYRRYLRNHPEHAWSRIAYGAYLYDQFRPHEAVEQWQAALAIDPDQAMAYNNLAEHYAHHGDVVRALRYWDRAIALEPQRAVYHFNWAMVCSTHRVAARTCYGWDSGEIMTRGLAAFRRARELAPADPAFGRAYAETFDCLPDPDWQEAYAAWEFCLSQPLSDRERQWIYGRLARVAMRLKDFELAINWMEKINDPELLSMRAALDRKRLALLNGAADPRPPMMYPTQDVARP